MKFLLLRFPFPCEAVNTPAMSFPLGFPTGVFRTRVLPMRLVLSCLSLIILLTVAAGAETHTFIVDSDDGYGVNRCLATGASCGVAVASAYCRSQAFAEARSFRKVTLTDITASLPEKPSCRGACNELVAIECAR